MGIKNLYKLINLAPAAISKKSFKDYNGKIIAIDASITIYQLVAVGKSRNIVNAENKFINHISGLFYKLSKMILNGIQPVCVFDGPPPQLKEEVIQKRKIARETGKQIRVPHAVFDECKILLNLMGIPFIQSSGVEAEAECAHLSKTGKIYGCATEDTDYLAFGGNKLIRGMDSSGKTFTEIDLDILLEQLELTYEQFVDLCILLGSDYAPGINTKPETALKMIQEHKTIGNALAVMKKKPPANIGQIQKEFKSPKVATVQSFKVKKLSPADIDNLRKYLVEDHGLLPSRIDKTINELRKYYQ